MASTELSNLVSLGTSQVPTDLAYIADLSAGAAGSKKITLNDLFSVITRCITDGALRWGGIATGSEPAVSAASGGSLFYNSTDQAYKVSENTGAYDALVLLAKTQTLTNKTLGSVTIISVTNATTAAIDTILDIRHASSGTPAVGFGSALRFALASDTTANRQAGLISAAWLDATDASLRSQVVLSVADVVTARSFLSGRVAATGSTKVALGTGLGDPTFSAHVFGDEGISFSDAVTNSAPVMFTLDHDTSGTAAAGFGSTQRFLLESSTTASQLGADISVKWAIATHASRASSYSISVYEQTTAVLGFFLQSTSGIPQIVLGAKTITPGVGNALVTVQGSFVAYPVALTDAATIATDASLSNNFGVTLAGNRTLGNPTNAANGQVIVFMLIQDATGSRTITLDSKFAFGTDITGVVLTTTASKRDFLTVKYDSTADKFYVVAFVKGY